MIRTYRCFPRSELNRIPLEWTNEIAINVRLIVAAHPTALPDGSSAEIDGYPLTTVVLGSGEMGPVIIESTFDRFVQDWRQALA